MGYNLNYTDIRTFQTYTMNTLLEWENTLSGILEALGVLAGSSSYSGMTADRIKGYITEVHMPICRTLLLLLETYRAKLALYVSEMYAIDNGKYANINDDALQAVKEQFQYVERAVLECREEAYRLMEQISDIMDNNIGKDIRYTIPLTNWQDRLETLKTDMGDYEVRSYHELSELKDAVADMKQVVTNLADKPIALQTGTVASRLNMEDIQRLNRTFYYSNTFLHENSGAAEAAYEHFEETWETIHRELREEKVRKGTVLVSMAALSALGIAGTFGAATPGTMSAMTTVLGETALVFDASACYEGQMELYYGLTGQVDKTAKNPIRDTLFFGWQKGYDIANIGVHFGFGCSYASDLEKASCLAGTEFALPEEEFTPFDFTEWDAEHGFDVENLARPTEMGAVLEVPEGYPQTILSEEIGVPPEAGDGGLVGDLAEGGSYSETPMSGDDWHRYFNEKYGTNNVTWDSAAIDDIIDMPSRITDFSPEQVADLAQKSGWSVEPLGKGSIKGIPHEQDGGLSMHAPNGSSFYIQYHPGGGHHGEMPYFKVSSGPNGTRRFFINGLEVGN